MGPFILKAPSAVDVAATVVAPVTSKLRQMEVIARASTYCIEYGHYHGIQLDDLNFGMFFSSPTAIHSCNLTTVGIGDVRANEEQRTVLEAMIKSASLFSVFMSLRTNVSGFRAKPFEVRLDGTKNKTIVPNILSLGLTPMTNAVNAEVELTTLNRPTGFTSQI